MIGLRTRFDPLRINLGHYLKVSSKRHFLGAGLANLVEYRRLELRQNQLDSEINSEGSRNENTDSFDIICTLKFSLIYYTINYLWCFQSSQLFCPFSLISLFGLNFCYLPPRESQDNHVYLISYLTTVKR